MAQPKNLDKALKKVKAKALTVSRLMNSPVGVKVIKILESEFPGGVGKDPYDTYRRLGNREPLEYLKSLQRIAQREDLE